VNNKNFPFSEVDLVFAAAAFGAIDFVFLARMSLIEVNLMCWERARERDGN
jgi:hypothetical protein